MDTVRSGMAEELQARVDETLPGGDFPLSLVISDPSLEDNPLIYVSDTFERLTGYDRTAVIGRNCRFLQGEETDPAKVRELSEAIKAEENVETVLYNYRADGRGFWNKLMLGPLRDERGAVRYFVGVQRLIDSPDNPDRHTTDEILAEIQHRVKNHLSMVIGMIRIQAREPNASDTFDSLARRVEALQLLYSEMNEAGAASRTDKVVPLGAYLSRIASAISYIDGRAAVRVNVDADAVEVEVETAARTGLVFSEILTNSLQHAFADRDEGVVEARAKVLTGNILRVTVMDDGVGFPEDSKWPAEGNLGAKIVRNLVEGLEGELSVETEARGTTIKLDIPLGEQSDIIAAEQDLDKPASADG